MIARVFPRRTNATPVDEHAFVGEPHLFTPEGITEVHVSATFSWDLPEAERLARVWSRIAPVKIGGPATGERGEEFIAGRYLKPGYVITSRGCPNNCWFCSVPQREGNEVRELPIVDGWNVLDDNLLACSEQHIRAVFNMLKRQQERVLFTGGMEARRLKPWHIDLFKSVRPKEIFFAYDTPDDWDPLEEAARMFRRAGYGTRNILRAYVLVGYPGDTIKKADKRCMTVKGLDVTPMAMPYQAPDWSFNQVQAQRVKWSRFMNSWARPAAIWSPKRDKRYLEEGATHVQ